MDVIKMKFPKINTNFIKQELVEFIRSEVEKSPYDKGIIGLSGGIDSAVVAYLACEALGKENLIALILPYKTSTEDVIEDAKYVASNLGIKYIEIDISPMIDSFLKRHPHGDPRRVGSKMVRERSALLYYYADLYKAVVMGTSNKSETLLGYFTKFGDPASDILPLKNLYKTHVIELAKAIGIPESIIEKPPSGGMWPGQTDENEFGFTYEEADPILYYIYDLRYFKKDLIKIGFNGELINKVVKRVHNSEFKRKHS
ncbi:MAG: NAD+ synthase, partial [Actinobacteria bacterium]|nr:NAD+ synthase [Actinomycetota bacterium]